MFSNLNNDNKDDDFLDEFRQKLGGQDMENFEEKKNEINRSKNVFIGAVSGIALAAVVGWFVLSPRYADAPDAELPVIRRPQNAVKVQPTEPGGMEILNQDKSVYDIIEKKDTSAPVVENLLPPPEEPQLPVIAAQPETTVTDKVTAQIQPTVVEQKVEEIIRVAEAPKPQPVQEPKTEPAPAPLSQAVSAQAPAQAQAQAQAPGQAQAPTPTPEPVVRPEPQPTPQPKTTPAPQPEPKAAAAGAWQVQLISSPNKTAMDSAWKNLVKKYPVLNGQPHEIETADLGSKGTFYRLKAGAFADRSGADNLCNDLKALGGSCIVKKK